MDLTEAYEIGAFIPDSEAFRAYWARASDDYRVSLGARTRLGLRYGDAERQAFDLFLPVGAPQGLLMFVHGGYWRMNDRSSWSHLAAGPVERGWAVAVPSYTLAPQARITDITREVAAALAAAATEVPGPIVVTGHSAGGHLSARMRCRDVGLPVEVEARLRRIVPIAPLCDLRPFLRTAMNADLKLDAEEAVAESPVLKTDLRDVPVTIWVGAEERPALIEQARWLHGAWPRTDLRIIPGRHHFDIIEGLEQPDSPLMQVLLS